MLCLFLINRVKGDTQHFSARFMQKTSGKRLSEKVVTLEIKTFDGDVYSINFR